MMLWTVAFFQKLSPCLVGIEACASSHHWWRELHALGHKVRLIPPAYVKPYGAPRRRVLPVEEGSTQRVVD
jgi:transposase